MPLVFISHAGPDSKAAEKVCKLLEDRGIDCWIAPRDVRPGNEFGKEIIEGIEACTAMVLLLSSNANESNFVKREVERAVSHNKPVFPVRLREVEPSASLELFISSTQWIDAWKPPIEQWLNRLIQSIHSLDEISNTVSPRNLSSSSPSRRRWLPWAFVVVLLAAGTAGIGFYASGGTESAQNRRQPNEANSDDPNPRTGTLADSNTTSSQNPTDPISGNTERKPSWSLVQTLSGHGHSVQSVVFDDSGEQLVSGSHDTTLKLWNVRTGECLRTSRPEVKQRGSNESVSSVAISPEGGLIASAHGWGVRLWNLETGEVLQRIESIGNRACYAVAFSPNGQLLALPDGGVQLWDIKSETSDSFLEDSYVTGATLAFSQDGTRLATVGDASVKIWSLQSGEVRRTIKPEDSIRPQFTSVAFNSDGSRIAAAAATGSAGVTFVWDATTGKTVHQLSNRYNVNAVAFSPDDAYLASGGWDGKVTIRDAGSGKVIQTLEGESGHVESVTFSRDASLIAAGFTDQVIKIWKVR